MKSKYSLNSTWLVGSSLLRMHILTCFQLFPERNLGKSRDLCSLFPATQIALLYAISSMLSLVVAGEMEFEVL